MKELKNKIFPYVLQNAVFYNGKAELGSVLGKVLGENPELRKQVPEVKKNVENLVKEINKLSLEEQKSQLEKLNPKMLEKEEKKEEKKLPELPGIKEKIVMRMAPNPNGPLHIGHCRMAILNDEYTKKYGGTLLLRFDDTDPKNENKIPMLEAYNWIQEDLKWLGVKYDRVERASDRLDVYYSYFKQFLERGFVYVCLCEQEVWSKMVREQRKECPCRKNDFQKNLDNWEKMLAGEFKEGQAVGRIRADFKKEKNPAVLDWVAFRIIDNPQHPLVKKFKVWPTLDFASSIDDKEFAITHIIRGKDLASSEEKQLILYKYLGWRYPITKVYGKFMTSENLVISKSKIQEGIKSGLYTGYDDPKLVFLKALRRRGIHPQAIRNYILNLGLSEAETTVDLDILYSENRKITDPGANRYMIVLDPYKIEIEDAPEIKQIEVERHPDDPKAGKKIVTVSKTIFVSKDDFNQFTRKVVRLKGLFNVKLENKSPYKGNELERGMQRLQWVSGPNVKVRIVFPDKTVEGLGEPEVGKLKVGQIIQMERIGYGRVDKVEKDMVTIYFSHK